MDASDSAEEPARSPPLANAPCSPASCSCRAMSAATGAGSQPVKSRNGRSANSSHRTASSEGEGRAAGSAASVRSRTARSGSGYDVRSGGRNSVLAIFVASVMAPESPYGWRPVAATAAIRPREKTSAAGVCSWPFACSGDMNCGVPISPPLRVSWVASAARAMPKSMIQGPSEPMRMLLGFRSRWITPALCTACSASAAQPVSWSTVGSGSGPCRASTRSRAGPGT